MFDEQEFWQKQREREIQDFLKTLQEIDDSKETEMLAAGYRCYKIAERTVSFKFGTVTFPRKVYRKGNKYRYPVDEELRLVPNIRYSLELILQIADFMPDLSYRKCAKNFEKITNIYVTKETVFRARKYASNLYKERKEYEYYKDEELLEKIKVDKLYVEGDGIMVKTIEKGEVGHTDLPHFVVHEGVTKEYGKRNKLVDKYEILNKNLQEAKDELANYLNRHYEITADTLLITNSDMGRGYQPETFKELAALFKCKHAHFWDAYHLNVKIKAYFKDISQELMDMMFNAIKKHDRKKAKLALDTAEALIKNDEQLEKFQKFSNKLLKNFRYTKPAHLRGFTHEGIGIMEAQHKKLADRMKNRGMYWSVEGAETMAKLIIDSANGKLRDLFFGDWRKEYEKIKKLPATATEYLKKVHVDSSIPTGTITNQNVRNKFC